MNLMFLFGAGISIPAGIPRTSDLTNRITSGGNIFRHTDANYYLGTEPSYHPDNSYIRRVVRVTQILINELTNYYDSIEDREPNYEDIYFLCDSLYTCEMSLSRPDLRPLLDKLFPLLEPLLGPFDSDFPQRKWRTVELYSETRNYIRDVVWHMLNQTPDDLSYFSTINDAHNDPKVDKILIFTLNHDILLEKYFMENSIMYVDGFIETGGDFRKWIPSSFRSEPKKVQLYKLHGSINWFTLVNKDFDPETEIIGIPRMNDFWHLRDSTGEMQWPMEGRPIMLVGTENKISNYSSGIFLSLFSEFYTELMRHNKIIVSGYSFGDRGINRLLRDWILRNSNTRMQVVSPSDNLSIKRDGDIMRKTSVIQKGFHEVTYSEIKRFMEQG